MTSDRTNHRRRELLLEFALCLLLASLALLAYQRAAGHGFLGFDDPMFVTDNPQVAAGLTVEGIAWAFAFSGGERTYWQPLAWLSHMLDCELFGPDPTMHHSVNIGLHIVNVVLLFLFFARATGARWASALVAAVFALHPINVESVAWIASRKNLLSTLLWLLTMLAWASYSRRPGVARYLLTVGVFALGLLTKPMLVTLPFVLLLLDFWPLGRLRGLIFDGSPQPAHDAASPPVSVARAIWEKVPLLALSVPAILVAPLSVRAAGVGLPHETLPLGLRLANAVVSYPAYLDKILAPRDLAIFYPYPATVASWKVVAAGALVLSVTAAALGWWRSRPYLVVGWLWFVGTLVPVSGILQNGLWPAMADRWAYVPLIGVAVMVAWGGAELVHRGLLRPRLLAGCATVVLAALLAGTMLQVERWRTTADLFEHATLVTSRNHVAHANLGSALLDEGELSEAIFHLREAIQLHPRLPHAHNCLGIALARLGDLRSAVRHFSAALALNPDFEEARANLELTHALLVAPGGQQRAATRSFSTGIMGLTGPRSQPPGRDDAP